MLPAPAASRKEINVPCTRGMLSADTQVTERHSVMIAKLPLQIETPLKGSVQGLHIIRREHVRYIEIVPATPVGRAERMFGYAGK